MSTNITPAFAPLAPSTSNPSTTATTPRVAVTFPNTTGNVPFSLHLTGNLAIKRQSAPTTLILQAPSTAVFSGSIATLLSGSGSSSSAMITSCAFSLVPPAPWPAR